MLSKILPKELMNIIQSKFDLSSIYEIRIRRNLPICINVSGVYKELKTYSDNKTIYADKRLIDYVILRATESSLYCYNNQLKNCFITAVGGFRIGVCGEVVYDDAGKIKTIKNISSLNIRVPHEVINCSKPIMRYIIEENKVHSCLIISPPCCGKTTIIRDVARAIGATGKLLNILIVDERYEICAESNGDTLLNVGQYTDCFSGASKEVGFREGVRALRPDVIICDELASEEDVDSVKLSINSGVSVIATAHSNNFSNFRRKPYFRELINEKYFDYYVCLSQRNGVGTIENVFDGELRSVWSL